MKKYLRMGSLLLVAIIMLSTISAFAFSVFSSESAMPFSSSLAGRDIEFSFNTEPTWTGPQLSVNIPGVGSTQVGAFRYSAWLDGAEYEAFCLDPHRPGPENNAPRYVIGGSRPELVHILRYGHPNNARMTDSSTTYYYPSAYAAYVTRTALVYRSAQPGATLIGASDSTLRQVASELAARTSAWQSAGNFVPSRVVLVNGVENAVQAGTPNGGGVIVSDVFHITNSHPNNPVMFRWWSGTPAGTQIWDEWHNHLATFPNLPTNNAFQAMSFRLAVPENATVESVGVDVVGIHDAYAGQVWSSRTTITPNQFQEMVFFIPEMRATARMDVGGLIPDPDYGRFRILKTDLQDVPLGGAVFEITGNDHRLPMTVTVPLSGWTSPEFDAGTTITVREIIPPNGHIIGANLTQTVTIAPGQTEITTLTFRNEPRDPECPPPSTSIVRIQKINALTRGSIPGALIRLRGISSHSIVTGDGQILSLNTTGIDVSQVLTAGATIAPGEIRSVVENGVWTIYNLPYGAFFVEELRAPEHFSLLPANTGQAFWHLPPDVIIEADGTPILCPETDAVLDINIEYRIVEHPQHGPTNMILKTFENFPFGIIELEKICEITRQPIPGVVFQIEGYFPEGNQQGIPTRRMATTDSRGRIRWEDLPAGLFAITEISSAPGWINSGETVTVPLTWGQTTQVVMTNTPKSSLEVLKVCGDTGEPLSDAIFQLRDPTSGETWQATSGANGIAVFGRGSNGNYLRPNHAYELTELIAPHGFVLLARLHEVVLSPGNDNRITIRNWRDPSLTIIKRCRETHEPLANAVFSVQYENGQTVSGSPFTTDINGEIVLPWTLFEGQNERTLLITEEIPPPGFHLSDTNWKLVTMRQGENNIVTFYNTRMPTITVIKRDSRTNAPIPNAEFTIEKLDNPGSGMLTGNPFRTDENGQIVISYQHEGIFRIVESRAANNYWLDPNEANRTWVIELRGNEDYTLIVENTLLPSLIITKRNALTNRPVPLTHFRVEFEVPNSPNVELIGNFVTDSNGQIILPFVQSGWYRITEVRPGPGMSLPSNPVTRIYLAPGRNTYELLRVMPNLVEQEAGRQVTIPAGSSNVVDENDGNGNSGTPPNSPSNGVTVTDGNEWLTGENIWNFPLNSIVIKKSCANTGTMLSGATFELRRVTGGISGTSGTLIGTFTTGASGIIVITGLEAGHGFIVEEVIPPNSFTLSENNQQQVWLAPDQTSIVELNFRNDPYGSLLIVKTNSENGRGLANARFRVTYADGTVVGNANGIFTSNAQGEILIPNLAPGSSIIATEIASPPGFQLDSTPQTIQIGSTGRTYRLEFQNTPIPRSPSLTILKICSVSRRPLQNVHFEVSTVDGTRLRNPQTGMFEFITDRNGLIYLPELEDGKTYFLRETRALPGFQIIEELIPFSVDARVRRQDNILVVENTPIASLRLLKRCSVTQQPIYGVEFMVFDSRNQVIGVFRTDNRGLIEADFAPQRVTIRETRPAAGFARDDVPRTIDLVAGRVTEVTWENTPQVGQLQILKVSGDDNRHNGLPSGTPLQGAIFHIYDARTGNLVDRIQSNERGMAVSRPLPIGRRYVAREVYAPAFYIINPTPIYFDLEHEGQIIRTQFPNFSANTGVSIRKTGVAETMQGHHIGYTINHVRNESSIALDNFFWRDILPTNAVRADRLITGTFNADLRYRVYATTNHGYEIVVADNLSTLRNNVINLRPAYLGLAYNEYIVDFTVIFGRVPAGFTSVEAPRVYVDVLSRYQAQLPNGMLIVNKVDVGGRVPGTTEWVVGNSTTSTTLFVPHRGTLPRSGW